MPAQDPSHAQALQDQYEIRPDPVALTHNNDEPSQNAASGVDYEPHPEKSIPLSAEHEKILKAITSLYSGSASKEDMEVYAHDAIYDDPWSYCDTRYKIAGQWYGEKPSVDRDPTLGTIGSQSPRGDIGIPKIMASSQTLATEVVSDKPTEIIYKQKQEYKPRPLYVSKAVNSLVTLTLDGEGKVRYHKDQWNEKDYSHSGLGKIMKDLNGDHLTKITRPPKDL
ncbi:hypothetical protein MMC26_005234 [Xylographa opegraphella]|nr:hypothetical protein [Xylographa opegraphella]